MAVSSKVSQRFLPSLLVMALAVLLCLTQGRYPISLAKLLELLFSPDTVDPMVKTVVISVRLPRVLLSLLVGGILSVSGAVYQGVFQNSMASPDLLGASTGAALGATIGILLGWGSEAMTTLAFLGGISTLFLVLSLSRVARVKPTVGLILAGIMVSSLFSSVISVLKLIADPMDQLPAITYWMMGSLAGADTKEVTFLASCTLVSFTPLYLIRWQLNGLAMGEVDAHTLGISVKKIRLIALVSSTLLTAAAVSVGGVIGWVGLVVPHFARRLVGNHYHLLLWTSLCLGGLFLLFTDTLCRSLLTTEIPIGILTSFVGIPFFFWLLTGRNGGGL